MKLEEARNLTKERVEKANETFGINKPLVVKIDKCGGRGGDFGEWAERNKSNGVVSLTPFDHFGLSDNIIECRRTKNSECRMDPACTTPRSNTTLFVSAWEEWIEEAKHWDIENIKDELGLWYEVEDACVIVLEVLDRSNIRVPCAHIPSVDCPEKCNYGEDLPANMCDDRFQMKYPELHGIIEGQGLCENNEWSMPFKGDGETPNGMKEYILNMGPEVKVRVKLKIPLKYCLEIIKGGSVTANNFIPFNNFNPFTNIGEIKADLFKTGLDQAGRARPSGYAGGGKNKKSKKRRSKTKRRKNSKRRSKKKRSKKRRTRKY